MFIWKDPKAKDGTCCPRPLSRKKLRQLMRHNHENLTSSAMASRFGRQTREQLRFTREEDIRVRREEKLKKPSNVDTERDKVLEAAALTPEKGGMFGNVLAAIHAFDFRRMQRKAAKG